jgi:hypothetical protein
MHNHIVTILVTFGSSRKRTRGRTRRKTTVTTIFCKVFNEEDQIGFIQLSGASTFDHAWGTIIKEELDDEILKQEPSMIVYTFFNEGTAANNEEIGTLQNPISLLIKEASKGVGKKTIKDASKGVGKKTIAATTNTTPPPGVSPKQWTGQTTSDEPNEIGEVPLVSTPS